MTDIQKPAARPANPRFSSGPCSKRPGWSLSSLPTDMLGRSHRSAGGKQRLAEAIDKTQALLELPDDYRVGIVPASDTGAVEMALWSLLGARPVTMMAWESFGAGWVGDVTNHLKLDDVTVMEADYGKLPDLAAVDFSSDVVFTWNGTTAGVRVPNADWIPDNRQGLTICDATSAVFAQKMAWEKLDVVTYSWQKVLGGEGAHGMLILSPRAVERLETYTPAWPLPKIFRLTKKGKLIEGIFRGETINTPSMLAVQDYIDALDWAQSLGGYDALVNRANQNLQILESWVAKTGWVDFLCADEESRSNTSVCLMITDPDITSLPADEQAAFAKKLVKLVDAEEAGFDFGSYRDAPAGLRIWTGATIEASDLEALIPWLDWAFATVKSETIS